MFPPQISHSVVSNSLWPHELQHARPPCPSAIPRVHLDSRPSSQWCHQAISSSVVPLSSCPQSLPASEYFPMSQLFAWGGQSTGVSALASVLPMNTQDWPPLGWTCWVSSSPCLIWALSGLWALDILPGSLWFFRKELDPREGHMGEGRERLELWRLHLQSILQGSPHLPWPQQAGGGPGEPVSEREPGA